MRERIEKTIYNVAIYIRLSKEDVDKISENTINRICRKIRMGIWTYRYLYWPRFHRDKL